MRKFTVTVGVRVRVEVRVHGLDGVIRLVMVPSLEGSVEALDRLTHHFEKCNLTRFPQFLCLETTVVGMSRDGFCPLDVFTHMVCLSILQGWGQGQNQPGERWCF